MSIVLSHMNYSHRNHFAFWCQTFSLESAYFWTLQPSPCAWDRELIKIIVGTITLLLAIKWDSWETSLTQLRISSPARISYYELTSDRRRYAFISSLQQYFWKRSGTAERTITNLIIFLHESHERVGMRPCVISEQFNIH